MRWSVLIGTMAALTVGAADAKAAADPHAILADVGKVVSDHGIDEARAVEIGGIKQWMGLVRAVGAHDVP